MEKAKPKKIAWSKPALKDLREGRSRGAPDCADGYSVIDTCAGGGWVVPGCVNGGIPAAVGG